MRNQGGAVKGKPRSLSSVFPKSRGWTVRGHRKWFKRGGKGEVAPIPPPEGEDQSEHVRQVKHTGLDIERAA